MSRTPHIAPAQGGGSFLVAWRLRAQRVLIVGGGGVAAGRVRLALEADATVLVVAPVLGAELRHRWRAGEIDWRPETYAPDHLDGVGMVLACLDDHDESALIAQKARARGIPVNCADHVDLCDFWFTSQHRQGPLQVSISTNGQGPALGARLKRRIAGALPDAVGEALEAFGRLRREVRRADPKPQSSSRRMRWLTAVARAWEWDDLAGLDADGVRSLVAAYVAGDDPPDGPRPRGRRPERERALGRVQLVGAGPGDPGLLTVRAREALATADVVLSDRLVPAPLLDLVEGELRIARKLPGRADAAQAELHRWILEAVEAGRHVVRLKCGDPFVFGRGGEEVAFLARHGITAEVVPGVTSALSAPVAAGIPTTMRGVADRVLVLTAHGRHDTRPAAPAFDDHTTYVWLMGVRKLATLVDELRAAGFPDHWPAALVERATHPDQQQVVGTLATLPALARQAGIRPPAAIVVGRVVDAAVVAAVPEAPAAEVAAAG